MKVYNIDIRSFLFVVLSCISIISIDAQPKTEDLGNVWIITIDKSGSMKDGKSDGKFKNECSYALSLIDKFRLDTLICFNKDRFFVYHTGLFNQYENKSLRSNVKIANVLSSDSSFTDLFIHPYKNQYRLFKNYSLLKNSISTSLLHTSYVYKWSFVSQISVTALDKALNYLAEHGYNDSYQDIYILTITDDADANDQWKNDYRVIKSANRARLEELNSLQEKLIYNKLTGKGCGELEEMEEDDQQGIHVYLYRYRSKQQLEDDTELAKEISANFSFEHVGANKIIIGLDKSSFLGNSVVYWQIDTVKVNGEVDTNQISQKYEIGETELNLSNDISNLRFNHIDIAGKIQILYQDSILGSHYKDIPFYIQKKFVASQTQHKSFMWILLLIAIVLICFLVYYFVILPQKIIFVLYLPDNRKISIKHGYKYSYASQVPLMLQTSYRYQQDYIINNNTYISVAPVKDLNITDNKIIIVSKVPLNLENPVFIADVFDRYVDCSSEMSDALQYDYMHTIQSRLIHKYSTQNAQLLSFTRWLFDVSNRLYPRYYYEINSSNTITQYTIESPLRSRTLFLLDFQKNKRHNDGIVEKMLELYYSDHRYGRADAIIATSINEAQSTSIDICLIEQKNNGVPCISNVNHIYHYSSQSLSTDKLYDIINYLKRDLRNTLKVKRIVTLDVADESISSNGFMHYNISKPVFSRFLLFIEANENHRSQVVYSPFVPYSKFVSLRPTKYAGNLYEAILPVANNPANQLRKLSADIVRINTGTIQRLEFEGNNDNADTIILGQNKINIETDNI